MTNPNATAPASWHVCGTPGCNWQGQQPCPFHASGFGSVTMTVNGKPLDGLSEPLPRLALNPAELGTVLGISKTYAYMLVRDGSIRAKRVGSRWLIPVEAIREFLDDPRPVAVDKTDETPADNPEQGTQ